MAPNMKLMGFTMGMAILSKWLLDTEDPGRLSLRSALLGRLTRWLMIEVLTVQAWAIRGAYIISQFICYGILGTIYYKAKVRVICTASMGGVDGMMVTHSECARQNNTESGVVTVKEDVGFGQVGDKDEKITISEHDMRFCKKELQRVRVSILTARLLDGGLTWLVPADSL